MTEKDLTESAHAMPEELGALGERLVYLMLRLYADRKRVVRVSIVELAQQLGVNRQTVLSHVEKLLEKKLVRRAGHGRYLVYPRPWSIREETYEYLLTVKTGDLVSSAPVIKALWGKTWDEVDDRTQDAVLDAFDQFDGKLWRVRESDGEWVRT